LQKVAWLYRLRFAPESDQSQQAPIAAFDPEG